jgi:SAM-dependent methyltransferase
MAKQGEIDYLAKLGPEGTAHARGKPFTDAQCGALLADIGGLLMVMPPPPARVLDLGCGSGWTSEFLARRGYEVVGQDLAPDMIALAKARLGDAGAGKLSFVVCDHESLPFLDEFDVALFYDALHHAVDPAASMASAFRALKSGGVLVTLEPGAGHSATQAAKSAVQAFDVTERDMPPELVARLGRAAGFRDAVVHPMPKVLAMLQYQARAPRWWPTPLLALYRWLLIGWVTIARRHRYDGMVVLRK